MKNILTEALVNSATNASFIFSYTNSAKLRLYDNSFQKPCTYKNTDFCNTVNFLFLIYYEDVIRDEKVSEK